MAKERINFNKDYKLFAACEKAESSADVLIKIKRPKTKIKKSHV